jgi:hypothetical protein
MAVLAIDALLTMDSFAVAAVAAIDDVWFGHTTPYRTGVTISSFVDFCRTT